MLFQLRHIILYATLILGSVAALADNTGSGSTGEEEILRPVNSAFMLEAGSSHLLETYLSPLHHSGWHTAFDYERQQAMKFSPRLWRQRLNLGVEINSAGNPARNASLLYGNIAASWSMSRIWHLPYRIDLSAGGTAGANLGGIYSARNSNNPAALKADIYLGLTATAGWKFNVSRLPVTLRWQTSLPVIGMFFAPEYDELYYEIYLGNRDGLIHCGWPGKLFRWDNLVTADFHLGNTALRLGFRSRIYSSQANHLTTRDFSYGFVLGVVTDWLSVSPCKGLPGKDAEVEWAY